MAVKRNYRINLRNYGNPPAIMVSQYDENYDLVFEVYDGVVPATGLNAYTVKLAGRQPGEDPALKYEFTGTVSGIANNILSFTIDTTMTGRAGKGTAEIVILDTTNDVKFASFNLPVYVEKAAVPDDAIDADVERAQEIADEVQDIVDTAAAEVKGEAEAWAVGERDGEPVPATDPAYNNNAKYYAQQAAQIAEDISGVTEQVAQNTSDIGDLKEDLNYTTSDITRKLEYVRSENLCRGDNTVTLGYMGMDGHIYTSQTLVYTEKIPVNVGEVIRAYCVVDGAFAQRVLRFVTAFDTNGNVLASSGADNKWVYTVPDGVAEIIISTTSGSNYMIAIGAVRTAYTPYDGYYKATDDFIGDILNNRLGEKVDKDGIEQVKSANIEGMTEAGAGISSNLFSKATLVAEKKYVAGIGGITGKAYLLDSQPLDTYIIPVDGVSTYTFTNCRTAIVVSDLEYTPVGELLSYATSIDSAGGKYILFSFNTTTYSINNYSITKPVTKYTIPSNWIIPDEGDLKKPIDSTSGTGTLNIVGRSALKDGELITFKGFFDTFSEFSLNFYGSTITNYIKVDATNITIKNNTSTPTPQAHGLTIQNDVALTAQFIDGTMKIALYSNGELWTSTLQWYQTNGTVTQPQIAPNGMTFTNAILNVVYDAVTRGIWYFGDSYTGITSPDRWVYYLKEDGFSGNALINGSAGSTSSGANTALSTLLKYGTPKFAVMGTGMNDGSDTDGHPTNLWINSRDAFITACQNNGIEPIFATIPTVPTVNNEAKNAWVKASGYRYIDFAKAVGADGTGAWYNGMLSGDNVHPTTKGAKALYTQVLIDLPEITISN